MAKKKQTVNFMLHEKQSEVFDCDARFRVVVAGRRFGKTKLSMLEMLAWATKKMQKIWYVAPTYRMAKQIMWNDLKSNVPMSWVSKIRENELSMEFRNGSVISLRGADKPDSLRGVSLDFLVLDEFQDIAPETWTTVLRPTLADRKGHALMIGCVNGKTRVITDKGLKRVENFCTDQTPKTLTPADITLYGINRSYHQADNFWNNGVVETRKITTHFGFEIEASLPHPLWTIDENGHQGWKKTEDLKTGDMVAIARGMEQWGAHRITNGWEEHFAEWKKQYRQLPNKPVIKESLDLAYFLGLWIAEGSVEEKVGRLTITCGDNVGEFLDERVFGIPFKQCRKDQWRINSYAVTEFMRFIGMPLTTASHKRLPDWLWSCSREVAAEFISGMWDGDGSIHANRNQVSYVSSSKELIHDLQLLLTNFGIISRVYSKLTPPTERAKVYSLGWRLEVRGANVGKLRDILKLRIKRKADCLASKPDIVSRNDGVPALNLLRNLKSHFVGTKLRYLDSAIATAYRTNSHTTYNNLRKILVETESKKNTEEYKALERIVANEYYWDKVEVIEKSECHTYDFTVPDTHSFWSNGFISHNTPKGYSHLYKLYKLGQNPIKQMKKEWMSWQFPTITSPFIAKSEIEAARRDMDEKMFRQEFCHLPETLVFTADGVVPISEVVKGDILTYVDSTGVRKPCAVCDKFSTGVKSIMELVLENGDVFKASVGHKLKLHIDDTPIEKKIEEAEWVEKSPILFVPQTKEEKLAALVGFNTSDRNISVKCGDDKEDLEWVLSDLKETEFDTKNTQEFRVPEWIMSGSDGVKRSYISALFGADGTTPSEKSYKHGPALIMTKIESGDENTFFEDLRVLMKHFEIETSLTVNKSVGLKKTHVCYSMNVNRESVLKFYENISYVYSHSKAFEAWKWAQYLHVYERVWREKTEKIRHWRDEEGLSFCQIGKRLGIESGDARRLYQISKGKVCNPGHGFQRYEDWISSRWNDDLKLLALDVVERKDDGERETFNITVDSPDHSYLLADGTNNFNCASFESMSGRVYYAFDRKTHIADVEFNPRLPIWVGMDFNIDPMSTVIFQPQPNGQLWAVDEIVQVSSNTDDICTELEKRYYKYQDRVTIYPDPAGSARQHARGESDLDIIREHGFKRIKVKRAHSAVADRINAVNRMLRSASGEVRLYINPKCRHLIESFEQTLYIAGSRDVDKSLSVEHSADAAGYCIELEFPLRKFKPVGYSR